jgi:hypothetical protein
MWVRQGRTDAWIAHKLDVSVEELARFKREHALEAGDDSARGRPADPLSVPPPEPPAADIEEEPEEEAGDEDEDEELQPAAAEGPDGAESEEGPRRRRRRGRRGGRRHRARRNAYEATFDHGQEGYGLWLDPAVADNPLYAEHWAGHRAVTVILDSDAITIRRAQAGSEALPDDEEE